MAADVQIPPETAEVALRALATVAAADGEVDPREHRFIDAAAKALGCATGSREPIDDGEVADRIQDPVWRERLVQAAELLAVMDGHVHEAEIERIARLSRALDVHDARLDNLRQIRRRHLRMLQLDLLRRSPMGAYAQQVWERGGVWELFRYLVQPQGYGVDPEEAWRYKQLGLLPENTLGRQYWAHMTVRRFPFPGEQGGFPTELVRHDLVHVLAGHDTDVRGECENATFIAGFLKEDPFSYLFMVAIHAHLDIEVFPNDPSQAALAFDPAICIPALQRGLRVTRDLYSLDWDYWEDMPRPIAQVRADYCIEVAPEHRAS